MIPSVDHLYALAGDEDAFERERNRLITEYIKSIPEQHRRAAYAMQCKIDAARLTLGPQEFLAWMQLEALELAENLGDQFSFIAHKAQDIKRDLKSAE